MWKCWLVSFILLYLLARTSCQKTDLDSPINLILLRTFRNWTYDTFGKTGTDERYMQAAKTINRTQSSIPINISFPCDVTNGRSPNVPNSVHKLRPGDIDVIAAMGDSLTAAAGALATSIVHILIENRGISPSGGGQATWREFLTLPNIIK
ncbi:phospholipase B1, membrane-associated-like, partial [Pseudomyrmex gracilis]|uniref:phospholipase B1, membrane-associated-like n=1 Tax=Pseudomyrmex gracilis TaxID=219809 RepID=UPI000995926E